MKKLYRSKTNRWLTGLCGGVGEYFGINPIIIRIVVLLLEMTLFGLIAYFILSYYVPERPDGQDGCVEADFEDKNN